MGANAPPLEALPHLPPSQKKKMAKFRHFQQIFGFLPPQNHILPLDAFASDGMLLNIARNVLALIVDHACLC